MSRRLSVSRREVAFRDQTEFRNVSHAFDFIQESPPARSDEERGIIVIAAPSGREGHFDLPNVV